MAIVTETTVHASQIPEDPRFQEILRQFNWFITSQTSASYMIFGNRSQQIGLFLEQKGFNIVKVSIKSIVHPDVPEIDSTECSSLMAALQACYTYCKQYQDFDFMRNMNAF